MAFYANYEVGKGHLGAASRTRANWSFNPEVEGVTAITTGQVVWTNAGGS